MSGSYQVVINIYRELWSILSLSYLSGPWLFYTSTLHLSRELSPILFLSYPDGLFDLLNLLELFLYLYLIPLPLLPVMFFTEGYPVIGVPEISTEGPGDPVGGV